MLAASEVRNLLMHAPLDDGILGVRGCGQDTVLAMSDVGLSNEPHSEDCVRQAVSVHSSGLRCGQ